MIASHAGHRMSFNETRHYLAPVKELRVSSDTPQIEVVALEDKDPHVQDVHLWCHDCGERLEVDEAVDIRWVDE